MTVLEENQTQQTNSDTGWKKKKRTREGGFNKGLMYIRNATNLCKHISVFVIA